LLPLDPPPPMNEEARHVIDRLTMKYRFAAFTQLAAVDSATAEAKRHRAEQEIYVGGGTSGFDAPVILDPPRAVRTELKPSAADIGSAVHLVLEHLDFARKCDAP